MPVKYRAKLEKLCDNEMYLTPIPPQIVANSGFETTKGFRIYPRLAWEKYYEDIQKLSSSNANEAKIADFIYELTTELSMDNAARMVIPRRSINWAGFEDKVQLIGHGSYFVLRKDSEASFNAGTECKLPTVEELEEDALDENGVSRLIAKWSSMGF